MSEWPRFRRRRVVVDPKFQYQFVGVLLLEMGIIVALLAWFAYAHINRMQDVARDLPQSNEASVVELKTQLEDTVRRFYTLSLVLVAATLVLLIQFGLFASHKLAGPVYKLKAHLRVLVEKDDAPPIAFRRKDRLEGFAKAINDSLAAERRRRAEIAGTLEALIDRATDLEGAGQPAKSKELLAEMDTLVLRLKGWTEVEGQS